MHRFFRNTNAILFLHNSRFVLLLPVIHLFLMLTSLHFSTLVLNPVVFPLIHPEDIQLKVNFFYLSFMSMICRHQRNFTFNLLNFHFFLNLVNITVLGQTYILVHVHTPVYIYIYIYTAIIN